MAKKLPNILEQLSAYGIENPLPPTIYIVYRNQEQYEAMKSVVSRYDDAVSTLDNISLKSSFEEQTRRASKLVTMMHVLLAICFVLIGGVLIMIGMVMSYIVTNLFYRFQSQIELTALLGGAWRVIVAPFVWVIMAIMLVSWLGAIWIT